MNEADKQAIKRYSHENTRNDHIPDWRLVESEFGEWVEYEDHKHIVDSQALEIERLKNPLIPRFNNSTIQDRGDDMGGGVLRLAKQEDGDICLSIHRRIGMLGVEFCSTYMGGGKSPETLNALRNLFAAMEQDNKNSPQVNRENQ